MTTHVDEQLPATHIRTEEALKDRLSIIDRPTDMPEQVLDFVVSHAGQRKNAVGIMNIIDGTVAKWKAIEPDHNWTEIVRDTTLVPEIASALTSDHTIALHGLFLATYPSNLATIRP